MHRPRLRLPASWMLLRLNMSETSILDVTNIDEAVTRLADARVKVAHLEQEINDLEGQQHKDTALMLYVVDLKALYYHTKAMEAVCCRMVKTLAMTHYERTGDLAPHPAVSLGECLSITISSDLSEWVTQMGEPTF